MDKTSISSEKSAESRARLARILQQRIQVPKKFVVSSSQRRLWFLHQLEPERPYYNICWHLHIEGQLHVEAWEKSIRQIVQRHDMLRTTFTGEQGVVYQVVHPFQATDPVLLYQDISGTNQQEPMVNRMVMDEGLQLFDLEKGPLWRMTLLKLHEDGYLFLSTFHHIIADGWSMQVFERELQEYYQAYSAGHRLEKPPLSIQYADYAVWQQNQQQQEKALEQLAYWKTQLSGAPALLQLPTDYVRPTVQSYQGGMENIALGSKVLDSLREIGRQESASLYMVLLASFQLLLMRYTGQEDVVVGTNASGRERKETQDLIGLFVQPLALRTRVGADLSFRALVRQVRDTVLQATANQMIPFDRIVDEIQPERTLSYHPLFQVMFSYFEFGESESHVDQIVWKRKDVEYSFSKFDLTLYIEGKGGEYQAVFEYSTDLFDRRTIQRMATHWQTLLGGVVQKPDGLLSTFPLMMSDERQRLLVDWNRTKVDYPSDSCIHQLFEKQVERAPRAVAVRCGDVEWTYQELNDQANRIAHQLLGMGVNIGESVAIMVPRSNEMIAAVLGVLKSGAAYVPIEPTLPDQRIDEICRQVQVSTVITHSSLREKGYRLQTDTLTGVIFIDHADLSVHLTRLDTIASYADWIKQPGVNPKLSLSSRSLAYILFTSGSTGKPKGVKVQHRSVVNLVDWVNRTFHIRSQDRGLSVVSLSFDLSVYDLFGLLAAGASIQLATDEERNNPFQLVRLLYQEPITFWNSAPAALQQLIPYCEQWKEHREKSHLRYVFVSGDWHPVSLPDRVRQAFPHAHIVNLGGPTETTVWSNYYPVDQVDPRWSSIPYGKPIQNVMFYVFDPHMNLCPVGVPGELYVGGDCLAEGFAHHPEMTRERFLPNPFSPHREGRMYKTGDRVRWRDDGNLEFLGRIDHLVKIRGFRIELGEIEAVLGKHPAVRENVALIRQDSRGENRLLSYIVLQEDFHQALLSTENGQAAFQADWVPVLQAYLKEQLPEYMIPSAMIGLEKIPITTNGKVDRRSLPDPLPANRAQRCCPRNPVEELLVEVWKEVLKNEDVGIHDHFFERGGHSLLASQVVLRLQAILRLELPLRMIFEFPTVALFSAEIQSNPRTQARVEKVSRLWERMKNVSYGEEERGKYRKKSGGKTDGK